MHIPYWLWYYLKGKENNKKNEKVYRSFTIRQEGRHDPWVVPGKHRENEPIERLYLLL
jgi:hypothetical protein